MSYDTSNIAVAAGLRSTGHAIERITVNGRMATFYFDDACREAAGKIEMGQMLVDAIRFHQELRRLSGLARSMAASQDD